MHSDSGDLGRLKPAPGAVKKDKRIGRGRGSGHGDTATKGHKGAQSRSGYTKPAWFEGGQMPIQRRIPKRGFHIARRTQFLEIKVSDLMRVTAESVGPAEFRAAGLISRNGPVVLLGNGEITKPVKIAVHRATKSAVEKVVAAGGSVEILQLAPADRRIKRGPKTRSKAGQKAKQAQRKTA